MEKKTIKGNMTYYYDIKVKSNTTYRYKVKVYKKFKKKKYSKYSNVKLVTTPKMKTNITDLQIIDLSNFDVGKTTIKDSYGNLYIKYFDTSCWSENQYVNLHLAEKYNVLNLTIAPHEETFSSMEAYIYIYADDELIYSSKSITKTTKPIKLNLNVKNVDVLKILQTENEWNCRALIISGNAVE